MSVILSDVIVLNYSGYYIGANRIISKLEIKAQGLQCNAIGYTFLEWSIRLKRVTSYTVAVCV